MLEFRSEHVVRIIAKTLIAQRDMGRLFDDLLAVSTQRLHRQVADSRRRQGLFQRFAVKLWQPPRQGERAYVRQSLNLMRFQGGDQAVNRARGMSDAIESGQYRLDAEVLG